MSEHTDTLTKTVNFTLSQKGPYIFASAPVMWNATKATTSHENPTLAVSSTLLSDRIAPTENTA